MRRIKHRLLDSPLVQEAIAGLVAGYLRLVWRTGNWRWIGREHGDRLAAEARMAVLCFWHGRMLLMAPAWPADRKIHMLGSAHRDGRMIARVIARFGISSVIGSTSRGAAAGLRTMAARLRDAECVAITPDGPRGPRMRAQIGVASVARLGAAPVLPVSFSMRGGIELGGWDRMLLPLPFGCGVVIVGKPIEVPADADAHQLEQARQEIERALNEITDEADRLCGRAKMEPEAAPTARRGALDRS